MKLPTPDEVISQFRNIQESEEYFLKAKAEQEKKNFQQLDRVRRSKHSGSVTKTDKTKRRDAAKRARASRKGNR